MIDHQPNREAKWQFRRKLLLKIADALKKQPENTWETITRNLQNQLNSPSISIRKSTRRWIKFAGNTPEKIHHTISQYFEIDTTEGARRHKLQDLSDGHPFAGIVTDNEIQHLRNESKSNQKMMDNHDSIPIRTRD